MRYPRAYLVFDKTSDDFSEGFFQNISGLKSKIYLAGYSTRVNTIENELLEIKEVDYFFKNYGNRHFLVMSNPKLFDFLLAYFSDKKLQIYWLDSAGSSKDSSKVLKALINLRKMRGHFLDGVNHYDCAFEAFEKITDRKPSGRDDLIDKVYNELAWDSKTILECELITLLKSKLRLGIANRIDLQSSTLSKSI
jgi:hypothetical protein